MSRGNFLVIAEGFSFRLSRGIYGLSGCDPAEATSAAAWCAVRHRVDDVDVNFQHGLSRIQQQNHLANTPNATEILQRNVWFGDLGPGCLRVGARQKPEAVFAKSLNR